METERYRRAKEIFSGAIERLPQDRSAYLNQACGVDNELRQQIESWLASHDEASDFLTSPTLLPENQNVPDPEQGGTRSILGATDLTEGPSTRIGPYKLLQLIGEGGFGAVFMAEQEFPVQRRVALKIIKLGMDTRQVIARFEAERQALAMMDHPNIARVLDAGATNTGRPYFVMELVKGVPITEYCDQNNFTTAERLELFTHVCRAVQHAHQKGIIHRDIKPNNVLVTLHDGIPVPKVIDFGIAKATNHRLTEKTLFTEFRQLIGTPQYMSPEQAEMSGLDIDTRSDIYSLGVLLYELLTGTTPVDPEQLRSAAYGEMQKMIRQIEPPRPSTRLSTLGATLVSVAAHRRTEGKKLTKLVQGELDWIVMKAIEKDRTRRYETANGLAMDVQRYLKDEPVLARPASTWYVLLKVARRHRAPLTIAAVLTAVLLLGIIGSTTGWVCAISAQKETKRSERIAKEQEAVAVSNGIRAQREAAKANAMMTFMQSTLASAQPDAKGGGANLKVVELLDNAAADMSEKLKDQPEAEIIGRKTLGMTYMSLGLYPAAESSFSRAHALALKHVGQDSEQTLELAAQHALLMLKTGQRGDADRLARETQRVAVEKFGEESVAAELATSAVGTSLLEQEKYPEAEALFKRLVERKKRQRGEKGAAGLPVYMDSLATAIQNQHRLEEAEAIRRELLEIRKSDLQNNSVEQVSQDLHMGSVLREQQRFAEAEEYETRALRVARARLAPNHPRTVDVLYDLTDTYLNLGKATEALPLYQELLSRNRADVIGDDVNTAVQLFNVGQMLCATGKSKEGNTCFLDAFAMFTRLNYTTDNSWSISSFWRQALLLRNVPQRKTWKSTSLHDELYWAMDGLFIRNKPKALDEFNVSALRFQLSRWDIGGPTPAGGTPATLIAKGGLETLVALAEPQPGMYLLWLDIPRLEGQEPIRQSWSMCLLPWQFAYFLLPPNEKDQDKWPEGNDRKPLEQTTGLSLSSILPEPPLGRMANFAAIATAVLDVPAGSYSISVTSDDGVRLYLDEKCLISNWAAHAPVTDSVNVQITPGRHPLRVEYFQEQGGLSLRFQVQPLTAEAKAFVSSISSVAKPFKALDDWIAVASAKLKTNPNDQAALEERCHLYTRRGQFKLAADDFTRLLKYDSTDHPRWYLSSFVYAQLGDQQVYREHCQRLLERFGSSADPQVCERTAKACLLLPDQSFDLKRILAIADRGINPKGPAFLLPWAQLCKGMAEYRLGHYQAAIDQLVPAEKKLKMLQQDGHPNGRSVALFFLAMSDHYLGRADDSRTAFASATKLVEELCPDFGTADLGSGWNDWLLAHLARHEAEAIILNEKPPGSQSGMSKPAGITP